MIGYIATSALLFAQLAFSYKVVNINSYVDKEISMVANRLLDLAPPPLPLPPYQDDELQISGGYIVGDSSLSRLGESYIVSRPEKNKLTLETHSTRRFYHMTFPSIQYRGKRFSGVFALKGADFHTFFNVRDRGTDHCSVTDLKYEMNRPKDVKFYSSLKNTDELDVPNFFEQKVLPYFNQLLLKRVPGIHDVIEKFACDPELQADDATLENFAKAMVGFFYN